MRMRPVALIACIASSLLAAAPEDRALGAWVFVAEKSTYESGPAPKQSRRQWILKGDQVLFLHDGTSAQDKPFHTEFLARYDNKPVPFTGGTLYDSVALKSVSPNVVEQTFRLKDEITVRAIRTISKDGKTMTIDARGQKPDGTKFNNLLIYRREK